MPLVKKDKFAPSQTPYAVMRDTFREKQHHGTASNGHEYHYSQYFVEAIWAKKTKGEITVSHGFINDSQDCDRTLDEFLADWDTRYGGAPRYKWDGFSLWTADPVMEQARKLIVDHLDKVLKNLPEVPEHTDGWYYRA